ncbi:MAG: Asp-tRNA(Asn)/Glu-tRNA(Gln) amidotransferase subunit GatA [Candidatus Yanofskybacteria bacterium]|nr:Asp-tRNA(Asn)/Glu-tRNA(Gln) amidotransferase subunit GatA [Candidatus Yanofskybacteria bacterium]
MTKLTVRGVQEGIRKREFSAEELHKKFLGLIGEENPKLNAYLSVFENQESGITNQGKLSGIALAVKDNICIKDTITTAGSKILKNHKAVYDATVISKLRSAGAIFLGKTNLDEFAMGASTENSAFGVTKNPHDHSRVPGGSSGGSAAAVAAGLAVAALGSDTGGSIRQPAAFCGVVGLKPTYGRVSRYGLISMASSLDQIGPLTKNVYDSALLLNFLAGKDSMDSTTANERVPDFTENLDKTIKGLKIAMPKEYFAVPAGPPTGRAGRRGEGLDSEVNNKVEQAISKLESLGAHVDQVSLPHADYALATYYLVVPSEVSSNLARYDGIRYGLRKGGENLLDTYLKSRSEGFGEEVRRRIILGTYALSSGYYDAYYLRAQKVRTLIRQDFEKVFEKFDIIVGPTTPTPAFKIGEKEDPLSMYLSDIYTVSVNLAGLPAISVPCGKVGDLPVGLQIIGKKFDEETVLRTAFQYYGS